MKKNKEPFWTRFADLYADENIYDEKKKLKYKEGDLIEAGSLPKAKQSIYVVNEEEASSVRGGRGAIYKPDRNIIYFPSTHPDVSMVNPCTEYSLKQHGSIQKKCVECGNKMCPTVKKITHWRKAFDE